MTAYTKYQSFLIMYYLGLKLRKDYELAYVMTGRRLTLGIPP